ncbi:zinc finger, CCHC-type containing protein [Tanacetum coccineum]
MWLVQNECSFHGLRSEDPNQHLKVFLKLVDSLDLDGKNGERMRLHLFQFYLRDQESNCLERLPAGSITTWEDLTTRFLAQFFPPRRTAKLRNDILMFQQRQGESLLEAWTQTEVPVKEAETKNEAKNKTKNKPIKKAEKEEAVEAPSSQPVEYYLKHRINEKLIEGLVDNHRLTTAKVVIKFDKGIITLRSGKSKISFNRIPESLCKDEKGTKNDIEPIAPTMSVNMLVLE